MAREFYKGPNSYVVYAEDSAFGTAGTPTASDRIGRIQNASWTVENNFILSQGAGEGRDATTATLGKLDISGSLSFLIDNFDIFEYFVGEKSGAGLVADPYQIEEKDFVGYGAGLIPTLTLEFGHEGPATDLTETIDGVYFPSFTINMSQGEVASCDATFNGRHMDVGSSIVTYTAPTTRPFTFVDGNVTVGSDSAKVKSFSLTHDAGYSTDPEVGSRYIVQPVAGQRRYTFSITMYFTNDDTASVLSGKEMMGLALGGTTASTSTSDVAEFASAGTLSLDLVEGAASNDRVVNIDLENVFITNMSPSVDVGGGAIEATISGVGFAGLTDGALKVPIRWYTIA